MGRIATQLYGAAIALVSGFYSLITSTSSGGLMESNSGLFMAVLGIVVVVHGVVLLTPYVSRLGAASGPMMIAYAILMLLNQVFLGTIESMGDGMGTGMNGGMGSSTTLGMGVDLGMVALAVLMLVSGVIMMNRSSSRM